jgi:hypothetical protein
MAVCSTAPSRLLDPRRSRQWNQRPAHRCTRSGAPAPASAVDPKPAATLGRSDGAKSDLAGLLKQHAPPPATAPSAGTGESSALRLQVVRAARHSRASIRSWRPVGGAAGRFQGRLRRVPGARAPASGGDGAASAISTERPNQQAIHQAANAEGQAAIRVGASHWDPNLIPRHLSGRRVRSPLALFALTSAPRLTRDEHFATLRSVRS